MLDVNIRNFLDLHKIRKGYKPFAIDMVNLGLLHAEWVAIRRRIRPNDDPPPVRCRCFNVDRQSGESKCPYCFGTFWDGGYYDTEMVKGSVSDEIEKLVRAERGKLIISGPIASLPAEPFLQDEDLMAWVLYDEGKNEILRELHRYKIHNTNYIVWDSTIIGTDVELVRLDPREIEMGVPFTI